MASKVSSISEYRSRNSPVVERSKAWFCGRSLARGCEFEYRRAHGCLSVVYVLFSGRALCDGLITRPEESYGCLSVVSVLCFQVEVSATD